MADDQQFCLRWNNFQTNFTSQFKALRVEEDFVDVTLACEGRRIKAHKLVLSACSPYFKELFKGNPCKHPIIFMQDVEYEHLMNLVEFMYAGQVNICQTKLPTFLHTAESLQIRGLSAQSQNKLPQNSEDKSDELRPGPSLGDSPDLESRASSPDQTLEEEGEGEAVLPSKRLRESTSYNDVPTTALIETKMEPMDYYSDGEIKPNTSHNSGSDHPIGSRSGYTLQGAFDAAASISAQISQLHEASQEQMQDVGDKCISQGSKPLTPPVVSAPALTSVPANDPCKPHSLDPRPCPECGRIYSNISNLRQHIRLIHYPECITCPLCYKPFKNKLYLRRHVMSYHEINLPNQNDRRYKYANTLSNSVPVFTSKSEAPEGFYDRTPANTVSMHSLTSDSVGAQKSFGFTDASRIVKRVKGLTESEVPSSL